MARIRSGASAATFSYWMPSVKLSLVGSFPSPSAALAQGKIAPSCSPYHSVVPTGTMPSASSESCSRRPTTTIRLGSESIVVSPNLCLIVTGKAPAAAAGAGRLLGGFASAAGEQAECE